ncbi:retrovirus-related pol polyprotein LINE-1 [Tanacetum coccineum]
MTNMLSAEVDMKRDTRDSSRAPVIITGRGIHGSLCNHLNDATLTWVQRLKISVGLAHALSLVTPLRIHKVDIACFQETKWKGFRTKEGNDYKLWYSGSSIVRNSVGVILAARLKDHVVQVTRISDRIIAILVVIDGETVNIISAYASQGDLNGHIEAAANGYAGVHGGFGFGARNEEGRAILEFATAHDLAILEHAKTAGPSQVRHAHCNTETFRATISKKLSALKEDMSASNDDHMWNTLARVIKDVAKDSLGVASKSVSSFNVQEILVV